MEKKVSVFFLFFVLLYIYLVIELQNPIFSKIELAAIDHQAFGVCLNLLGNPIVKNKETKSYVYLNPLLWLLNGLDSGVVWRTDRTKVYFGPLAMWRDDFEILAAHEIGHAERGTNSQHEANLFALRLVGNQKRGDFIKFMHAAGYSETEISNVLKGFDARYGREKNGQPTTGGVKTNTMDQKGSILLREVSPSAYQICLEIVQRSPFSMKPEIEFYVEPELKQKAIVVANKIGLSWIYLHPLALTLERWDFEALVAHELGHIDCKCGDEKIEYQIRADRFAARIVGKDSMRNLLLKYRVSSEDPRLLALK